jgi:hypothetical protein
MDCINGLTSVSIYLYDKFFELFEKCFKNENIRYSKINNKKEDFNEEKNTQIFEWDLV